MNMFLHNIEPHITLGDTLYSEPTEEKFDCILTNPPFGTRGANQVPKRSAFKVSTSSKQLNFVQHVVSVLKEGGRAAMVLPDNCLFENKAGEVFEDLMQQCNLHTILRLPRGTFAAYAQGVKANVIFFQKGGSTHETWIYDGRANIPSVTKNDRPLAAEHFNDFIRCYGENPNGTSKRIDQGLEGRFRRFDISEIEARGYKLDVTWLRDETLDNDAQGVEPSDLASEAIVQLTSVIRELEELLNALEKDEVPA